MATRYPLALACAYLFFVFLLWLWLRTKADDYNDFPDVSDTDYGFGSHEVQPSTMGAGGEFGGGGASGSFDTPASDSPHDFSSVGDAAGASLDLDEMAIPIIAIALAAGLALASLYVVYIAPTLFSELVFDGILSYTLYRKLRRTESTHWLAGALRHTAAPFAITALFLWAMGAAMASYAPGSHSIGEVIHHVGARH
jgi:hypothetical protein